MYIQENTMRNQSKVYMDSKEDEIILCIPIMDTSIDNEYIHHIFNKLNMNVEKIIEYINKSNEHLKRVIIHLKNRENSQPPSQTQNQTQPQKKNIFEYIKNRIDQNKDVKIVHNYPYYWKTVKAYK